MKNAVKKAGMLLGALLLLTGEIRAQELNCTVTLNYDQLVGQQKTDVPTMNQLQTYISDFMNTTRWTTDQFAPEERIKCKLNINLIKSVTQGSYEANAQFIITRPVFNATYGTVLLSYVDRNFSFVYLPNTPIFFNENSYTGELPYILAFYAYIALTMNYDSFSKTGGTPHLTRAFNIANLAGNSSQYSRFWRNIGDTRNRYWLVENLMNQQFLLFREALYGYYRLGLDAATQTPGLTRKKTMELLAAAKQLSTLRPGAVLINAFFDGKSEELYNIMREASPDERQQAYTLLSAVDPTKTELYRRLIE